ncbi:preprotein translocase subunit SecG [Methylobacterium planeticum]|uniref:Protein-export membrane protein SecG n=1 Tax=Methylobacterium planeticum TaxID=2615211 RepID=A0A6N6MMN9_9HYPH|nr:preprotein translocase subunit SecG [Methylobacterium planeticum]KAB1072630.1 preprotein translocase subunit SecG [Methylobacterium planeticum]
MQTVLIVVHLFIVLALIAVVLLQRSEGGLGLGGGGGGGVSGFMTGRGQANALTRATAILAALFFATSMTLAVMSHRATAPKSILDGSGTAQQPNKPANADNLLDTLRQQGGAPAPGAPAAPAAPAPTGQAPAAQVPTTPAPSAQPASPAVPDAPQSR